MKRWCIRWMIRKSYNGGYSFGCGGGGGRREEGCYGGGDGISILVVHLTNALT
ncbi:hypothetical protein ISN44_As10g018280 [Arabidopsis suecica]|uniref:Uncharacterized protein n=1 Tax=Arabidopsis suecica TaxID=45249 RepID=A0A8T1ZW46_ARASU|nr:hypothetical protein ISN44_As10g018280 [Arabidopsis suecica]